MGRLVVKFLLVVVALVVVLAAAFYFLARTEMAQRFILTRAVPLIEEAIEAKISIGRIEGTFTGGLVWGRILLAWPDFVLEVDEAVTHLNYLALLNKTVQVVSLDLKNPRGRLVQLPAQPKTEGSRSLALAQAGAAPAEKPDWRVVINRFKISDGELAGLGPETGPLSIERVEGIQGQGRLNLEKRLRIEAQAQGRSRISGRPVRFDLTGSMDEEFVSVRRLAVFFGPGDRGRLDLAGRLNLPPEVFQKGRKIQTETTAETNFSGALELQDLPQALAERLKGLVGPATLAGRAKGSLSAFQARVEAQWAGMNLSLDGRMKTDSLEVTASGRARNLDPARFSALAGRDLPAGRVGLAYEVNGRLPDDLGLKLSFEPSSLDGLLHIQAGTADLRLLQEALSGRASLKGGQGFGVKAEKVDLEGRISPQEADLAVSLEKARGWQLDAAKGKFHFLHRNDFYQIQDLYLDGQTGRLSGSAQVGLRNQEVCSAKVDLAMDQFTPPAQLIMDQAGLNLAFLNLVRLRLTGALKLDWPGPPGCPAPGGKIKIETPSGMELSSTGLTITSPWGGIKASGRVNLTDRGLLKDWRAEVDLRNFRVPSWAWPFLPPEVQSLILKGRLKLEGRLSGRPGPKGVTHPLAGLEMDASGRLDGSIWENQPLERLRFQARLAQGVVRFESLDFRGLEAELSLQGQVWPRPDLRLALKASEAEKTISLLPARLRPPLAIASAAYSGRLAGEWLKPVLDGALTAQGVTLSGLETAGVAFSGQVEADPARPRFKGNLKIEKLLAAGFSARSLSFDGQVLGRPERLALSGRLQAERPAWDSFRADGLDLSLGIEELAPARFSLLKGQFRGRIDGFAWSSHRPSRIDLAGQGRGEGLKGQVELSNPAGRLAASFELKPERLTLPLVSLAVSLPGQKNLWRSQARLEAAWPGGNLETLKLELMDSGRHEVKIGLDLSDGQVKGQGRVKDLELRPFSTLLGARWLNSGRLDLDLQVSGPAQKPELKLTGTLSRPVLAGQPLDQLSFLARLEQGQVRFEGNLSAFGRQALTFEAGLPVELSFKPFFLRPDYGQFRAKARVDDFPLAALAGIEEVKNGLDRLQGRLLAEVEFSPGPRGWLRVENFGARILRTEQVVSQGQVEMVLAQDGLTLKRFEFQTGGGRAEAQGGLKFKDGWPMEVSATLSQTAINLAGFGRAVVSGQVNLTRTLDSPELRGRFEVASLHLAVPRLEPAESREVVLVDQPKSAERSRPAALAALALVERSGLNLSVLVGPAAWVEGEGVKARLSGEVQVRKSPGHEPRIVGELKIPEGLVTRFGRRFSLSGGHIYFRGHNPPRPYLVLNALYSLRGVDITLNLAGPADQPRITLSSAPVMSQEDILAYLLFGQAAKDLEGDQANQMRAAAAVLASGPAAEVMRQLLDERLSPDVLLFSSRPQGRGGLSVEAGKQILPDLFLSYEAFTEANKPNEVHLEYRLTPKVSVRSSLGDEETSGVDLILRYDF